MGSAGPCCTDIASRSDHIKLQGLRKSRPITFNPPLSSIYLYIVNTGLYLYLLFCPSSISKAYFFPFSLLTANHLDWSSLRAASCFYHQHILIHSKLCLALRKPQDTCPAPGIIWTQRTLAGLHFTPYV